MLLTMLAGSAAAVLIGPAIGGAAAVGGFAIALAIVFTVADKQADDAFFAAYAQTRGLTLRRLFAPTFIVWLTESAPKKFAFELVDGALCCYVRGHRESAEELDEIAAATSAVAKRLQNEGAGVRADQAHSV